MAGVGWGLRGELIIIFKKIDVLRYILTVIKVRMLKLNDSVDD